MVRRILTSQSVGDTIAGNVAGMLNAMQASLNSGNEPQEAAYDWIFMQQNEASRWPTDTEVIDRISNHPHEMSAARRNMVLQAMENRLRIDNGQPPISGGFQTAILIPEGEIGLTNYPIGVRATAARLQRRNENVKKLGNFTLTNSNLNPSERATGWQDKQEALEKRGRDVLLNQ